MKLIALLSFFVGIQVYAATPSTATVEQTLASKGYAVLCTQALGVLQTDRMQDELNKKLQVVKGEFSVSQPSLSVSLINVMDKKSADPGSLAVLCVTLSKKN